MIRASKRVLSVALGLCACLSTSVGYAQLRIVSYNAATDTNPSGDVARAGMASVLQAIGIESKNGIQRPIDVLSLQEVTSSLGGATSIVNVLNSIYGAGTYARSTVVGGSTDGTTMAVVYNTHTVQLVGQTAVGSASTSGAARAPMRFEFQPLGYDSSADFFVYSEHYKAGTASSDKARRDAEAQTVRADANALGPNARVIFSGDYNIQSSSETMYQTLTAAGGTGRAVDPLNAPGTWNNNASFAGIHTQAPLVTGVNGLTGGGMDDRFDFQLVTAPVLSGQGFSYIGPNVPNTLVPATQQSYHAFGNNGTTYNQDLNSPSNTALPASEYAPTAGQPSRTTVLNALTTASDHLPVVADYQLPAKMGASLASVPTQVIRDSHPTATVSVANVAPVQVAIGADELTYQVTGSGAASGTGSGNILALAPAATHNLSLDTATVGAHSGSVQVTSTSVSVADGTFAQPLSYTVLDHAAPAFVDSLTPQVLTIDFGHLLLNSSTGVQNFEIANLLAPYRAGLDLNGVTEVGDVGNRFSTDLALFSNLLSGSTSDAFHLFFSTDQLGVFTARYLLDVADHAGIFGGTSQTLEIDVTGAVMVPEPSSVVLALAGVAMCLGWRRRSRASVR